MEQITGKDFIFCISDNLIYINPKNQGNEILSGEFTDPEWDYINDLCYKVGIGELSENIFEADEEGANIDYIRLKLIENGLTEDYTFKENMKKDAPDGIFR